jgi:hypothetical protein
MMTYIEELENHVGEMIMLKSPILWNQGRYKTPISDDNPNRICVLLKFFNEDAVIDGFKKVPDGTDGASLSATIGRRGVTTFKMQLFIDDTIKTLMIDKRDVVLL